MTSERKVQTVDGFKNILSLASIIALVILVALEVDIPTYIGVGLIGSALGAKWEEVIAAIRGNK